MTRIELRRLALLVLGALSPCLPLLSAIASAQSAPRRAWSVNDGTVRMTYPVRSGVCGDGKDVITFGKRLVVYPSIEGYGTVGDMQCQTGPVRVALTFRDGMLANVRTFVGGTWRGGGDVTDLGDVSAPDAADHLLALAARATGRPSKDLLLPAVIADGADIAAPLLALARDRSRPTQTRQHAIQWLGYVGGEPDVGAIARIARDDGEDRAVREGALVALAQTRDGSGVPVLIDIVRRSPDMWLRTKAVFWLAEADDLSARRAIREVIEGDAPNALRTAAIMALGHQSGKPEDGVLLREMYPRLEEEGLRKAVIQAMGQIEHDDPTSRWLLARALDEGAPMDLRRDALFWAQEAGVPTADLIRLYSRITDRSLKEHYLFVLSEREDDEATDKLIDIARNDADREMRKKALFWLAEKDDPRVARMIADLINK